MQNNTPPIFARPSQNEDAVTQCKRLWVRLPNWLGDVIMALPVLRAVKEDRPDMEITLVGKRAFEPLVRRLGIADSFVPLPDRGAGYFRFFYRYRRRPPDIYLLLTNSLRSDLEAFLTRSSCRIGMVRPGKFRPLLTQPYRLAADTDESQIHQTLVWEQMIRFYGSSEALDFQPVDQPETPRFSKRIGLICGTENSPKKRWPIAHWRQLLDGLLQSDPSITVQLYGTPADREIATQVCEGFVDSRVRNMAGETDLNEFCDALSACHVVCCNDTGGMHLANFLGTAVVAVFGPTNPIRTGPIFSAAVTVLQPDNCPPHGGAAIEKVTVEQGINAVRNLLSDAIEVD
ncbi:MAG: glycosyltransferase family 9 protein [Pseudomonadota bacterium]